MHRTLKPLKRCCFAVGFALVGCNMFNPSGEGDAGNSADAQLTSGENYFRQQDYLDAFDAYAKAIDQDSTNSLAYYGYAKSAMRYWDVNASTLLSEVKKAQDNSGVPFITSDNWTTTRYLQGTSKARKALGIMTLRDTLTRWYDYTLDSNASTARKDPLRSQRIAFMNDYFAKADKGYTGYYRKNQFPLSDLKMGSDKVVADFGFVELIYAVTHLRDLDGNDTIDDRDNLLKKLTFSVGAGGFKVDNLQNIAADLNTDSNRTAVNNLIQNVSSGLGSASKVLNLLGNSLPVGGASDSLNNNPDLKQKVTQNMDSVITSMGDAVTFYQFGDGKDNDGDGCIDEEILDGKDNDGDGFVDEDARINTVAPYLDAVDNDHNGKGANSFTDPDPGEALDDNAQLIFTTKSNFIKGEKYKDKAFKVKVQADSIATRTVLRPEDKDMLDSAKKYIGGCWNNY